MKMVVYKLSLNASTKQSSVRELAVVKETPKTFQLDSGYNRVVLKDNMDMIMLGNYNDQRIMYTTDVNLIPKYQEKLVQWAIDHFKEQLEEANAGLLWVTDIGDFVRRKEQI
jgi:hypothetical protein